MPFVVSLDSGGLTEGTLVLKKEFIRGIPAISAAEEAVVGKVVTSISRAPFFFKTSISSSCFNFCTSLSGVLPSRSITLTFAPLSIKNLTTSTWAKAAGSKRGVSKF